MHSSHLLLEEPIRMASILDPSKYSFLPALTKIVGTLGPKSRSIDALSSCLKAAAPFDFSWGDDDCHQETLDNLKVVVKSTKLICSVMLDTVGHELQVINKSEKAPSFVFVHSSRKTLSSIFLAEACRFSITSIINSVKPMINHNFKSTLSKVSHFSKETLLKFYNSS